MDKIINDFVCDVNGFAPSGMMDATTAFAAISDDTTHHHNNHGVAGASSRVDVSVDVFDAVAFTTGAIVKVAHISAIFDSTGTWDPDIDSWSPTKVDVSRGIKMVVDAIRDTVPSDVDIVIWDKPVHMSAKDNTRFMRVAHFIMSKAFPGSRGFDIIHFDIDDPADSKWVGGGVVV